MAEKSKDQESNSDAVATTAAAEPAQEAAHPDKQEESTPGDAAIGATKHEGGRKRKRHLYNAIRSQMEFYFGDANLSKDRFLRRHVEQDPFVPLDIFLTFNKIKALTQEVKQITKSLSNSKLLELDESGLKVRRKTELPAQRDVNDKTLYVEALPANASHEWLKEVFSRYGPVAYVSLPHYPGSKRIKEFAFIEFEKSGGLEKAVKAFAHIQGVLSVDTEPGNLASIRSFQKQEEMKEQSTETKRDLKRQAVGEQEQPDIKRLRKEDTPPVAKEGPESKAPEEQAVPTASASEPSDTEADPKKPRRRRRLSKKKPLENVQRPNIDPSALELKVLPKTSWCSLRNKYLNLQRRLVSEAKAKWWRESHPHQTPTPPQPLQAEPTKTTPAASSEETETCLNEVATAPADVEEPGPLPPAKRRKAVHKMNMNFYGAGGGEPSATLEDKSKTEERRPLFQYEPGLIVECSLMEPCSNVKEFKAEMRQYVNIKYVDIKEGDSTAYLRLANPSASEELVHQVHSAERQLKVLRGQAEQQYWRKIEQDREAKLSKKVRVQQKRGREKVTKLLAKHIKFDDQEEETLEV